VIDVTDWFYQALFSSKIQLSSTRCIWSPSFEIIRL